MTRVARRDLTLGSGTLAWEPVGEAGREGSPLELVILERAIPARARCRVCFAIFRAGSPSTPWFCSVGCVQFQLPRVAGNSRVSRIRIGILREGEQRHGVGEMQAGARTGQGWSRQQLALLRWALLLLIQPVSVVQTHPPAPAKFQVA